MDGQSWAPVRLSRPLHGESQNRESLDFVVRHSWASSSTPCLWSGPTGLAGIGKLPFPTFSTCSERALSHLQVCCRASGPPGAFVAISTLGITRRPGTYLFGGVRHVRSTLSGSPHRRLLRSRIRPHGYSSLSCQDPHRHPAS